MGWRVNQAYDEAQKKEFQEWKASLSWPQYWSWQFQTWGAFLGGVAVGSAFSLVVIYLLSA